MLPDFNEYAKLKGAAKVKRIDRQRPQLEMLRQAAIKAELLTGQEHWDYFLSLIEGAIKITEDQRVGFERLVMDPAATEEDMKRNKIHALLCDERIKAWRAVMTMPKDLMAEGEKARSLLDRIADVGNAA